MEDRRRVGGRAPGVPAGGDGGAGGGGGEASGAGDRDLGERGDCGDLGDCEDGDGDGEPECDRGDLDGDNPPALPLIASIRSAIAIKSAAGATIRSPSPLTMNRVPRAEETRRNARLNAGDVTSRASAWCLKSGERWNTRYKELDRIQDQ